MTYSITQSFNHFFTNEIHRQNQHHDPVGNSDPQGKAVKLGLHNLHMDSIDNVRIGKHIRLEVDADTEEQARTTVDAACRHCWPI